VELLVQCNNTTAGTRGADFTVHGDPLVKVQEFGNLSSILTCDLITSWEVH